MRTSTYRKGEVIIAEGEYTSDAYIVNHGFVEVYREGPGGQRLSVLGPGDIFGEMAFITERPRSASVRALEDVEVRVIDREAFLTMDPDALVPVMRVLCERIRTLNALVMDLAQHAPISSDAVAVQLADASETLRASEAVAEGDEAVAEGASVFVEGLTPRATESVGRSRVPITRFPFRIGRWTAEVDPFSYNELSLRDEEPYQVSRNHCAILRMPERYLVIDRASVRGTLVNGSRIGGDERTGCTELKDGDNVLALGGPDTPYRFRLSITPRA